MTRAPRRPAPADPAPRRSSAARAKAAGVAMPRGRAGWLGEIAMAWGDALESLPFMPLVKEGSPFPKAGAKLVRSQLFHYASAIAVRRRGLPKASLRQAVESSLGGFVALQDAAPDVLADPKLTFAFCYLASHIGLGLIEPHTLARLMEGFERNPDQLHSALGGTAARYEDFVPPRSPRGRPRGHLKVSLTEAQVDLLFGNVIMDDDVETMLHKSILTDGIVAVRGKSGDMEELAGCVAAAANHTNDRKLRKQLDAISAAVSAVLTH